MADTEIVDHRPPLRPERAKKRRETTDKLKVTTAKVAGTAAAQGVDNKGGKGTPKNRRTREEIIQSIAREEAVVKARMEKRLKALRERRERLIAETPEQRRKRERERRLFEKVLTRLDSDMGYIHAVGAVQFALSNSADLHSLHKIGEQLLSDLGFMGKSKKSR
ncbi:hypothetical protein [Acidithiobacillus sp.]|uniref:hypothetical protein n=1 Tax=Acidithiobacillus sp. TaxID=1872118 RepID=UPI002618B976|nr:hypothetical protein [Acidithiobacillus sp.]MDD5278751.1 hypothetical protein [Acidithiobacillus sp.]